ncbi:hypothetical protein [Stackebrandtia soli]|uniref:hypothetical protein n=1 Tax=Stackebrandtia soli TaxID=1892856 RepID=UPI0039EC96D0
MRTFQAVVAASILMLGLSACGYFGESPAYQVVSACDVVDVAPYARLLNTSADVEPEVRDDNDDDRSGCYYYIDDGTMLIDISIDTPTEPAAAEIFEEHRDQIKTESGWRSAALTGERSWTDSHAVTTMTSIVTTVDVAALDRNLAVNVRVQIAFQEIEDAALLPLVNETVNAIAEAAEIVA